jgi:hypothetical protein
MTTLINGLVDSPIGKPTVPLGPGDKTRVCGGGERWEFRNKNQIFLQEMFDDW